MGDPVEPPWLSDGSAPVATDQNAAAETAPAPPGPGEAPGAEGPVFAAAGSFGHEDGYSQEGAYGQSPLAQEGSYMPPSSYGYGQESGYSASAVPDQEDALAPPPPPYPAAAMPQQRASSETTAFRPPATAHTGASTPAAQRRRANLVVARLEPWSVMKFSFLMSLVAWVVLFVAVALLYYALSGLGVFHAIQTTLSGVTSSQGSSGFNLGKYISASKVLGYTMLFGAVNIVLITALSTIGAMIYNVVTHLGGGVEVTLRETD